MADNLIWQRSYSFAGGAFDYTVAATNPNWAPVSAAWVSPALVHTATCADGAEVPEFWGIGKANMLGAGAAASSAVIRTALPSLRIVANNANFALDCWPVEDGGCCLVFRLPHIYKTRTHDEWYQIDATVCAGWTAAIAGLGAGEYMNVRWSLGRWLADIGGQSEIIRDSLIANNAAVVDEHQVHAVGAANTVITGELDATFRNIRQVRFVVRGMESELWNGPNGGALTLRAWKPDGYIYGGFRPDMALYLGLSQFGMVAPRNFYGELWALTVSVYHR